MVLRVLVWVEVVVCLVDHLAALRVEPLVSGLAVVVDPEIVLDVDPRPGREERIEE